MSTVDRYWLAHALLDIDFHNRWPFAFAGGSGAAIADDGGLITLFAYPMTPAH